MGKTTAGKMFVRRGFPLWDADAAVHRLYAQGGAAVAPVAARFPAALVDGGIDRSALKSALADDPNGLKKLEEIVHPLVAKDRTAFIDGAREDGARIVVLDIPLLFETGVQNQMDGVAVVSTDAETQRARVLARPGMTEDAFAMIQSRQMPDAEKRALADWIIPSDTIALAESAVDAICAEILGERHA